MKKSLILTFIFLTLISCSNRKIYEKYVKLDNLIWNRFNVITFEVPIENISSGYDFYLAIRHHTDIPYKSILVNVTFYTPSDEMRTMNHRIIIKDENDKLVGDGLGDLWDLVTPVREDFRFTKSGICKFEISSAMSQADLAGIIEVGLIVKRHQ